MNSAMNESGFNVPQAPELPAPVGMPERTGGQPEQAPAAAETNRVQTQPGAATLPAMPTTIPAATTPQAPAIDATTTTNVDVNATADDTDLIEKEWVDRAKKIVERNKDDPYIQSNELGAMKADYLQKRYGKSIKLDV